MHEPKVFGAPRPRAGQLKVQWGKVEDSDPDLVFAGGEGVPREDRHLMHSALDNVRWMGPLHDKWAFEPSILEELEARGYDITTLKISIEKKAVVGNRPHPAKETMHSVCGVNASVSMLKVGQVEQSVISWVDKQLSEFANAGWPPDNDETDLSIADQYGFDAVAACDANNEESFVSFARGVRCREQLINVFNDALPALKEWRADIQAFQAWYAHCHQDHDEVCTTQVNLILSNEAGHRLLSIDASGTHHVITPEPGELILLDTGCTHAVLPNQAIGLDHMRKHPLRALFVNIPDVYDL